LKLRANVLCLSRSVATAAVLIGCASRALAQIPTEVPDRQGWLLFPSFQAAAVYEDNVLFTPRPAFESWLTRFSPGLDALYRRGSRHFEAGYTFDAERYPERFDTLNDVFARQEGYAELRMLLNPRSSIVFSGTALETTRPEEVLDDTGLLSLRRRSRGITANALFERALTRRLSFNAGYAFSLRDFERPEGLSPRLGGTVHSLTAGSSFRHSIRMSSQVNYTLRVFVQDELARELSPVNEFVSHVATYRFTRQLARNLGLVVALGPRFSEGLRLTDGAELLERTREVSPEAFAALEYRGEGAFITARYTRSQSQAFGLTGFVDTQNGVVNARFELGPRFHVEANPGVYQNERAGILTTSYQAELKAEYRFSTRAAFESAYLFQYQDRFLSLEDAPDSGGEGITRNTILFGLKLFTAIDAN
jgi:hypothetical protein